MIFKICAKNLREAKNLVLENALKDMIEANLVNVMINVKNTIIVVLILRIFAQEMEQVIKNWKIFQMNCFN